jgi:hypothetical protein
VEEPEATSGEKGKEKPQQEEKSLARVSREELYTQISATSKLSLSFFIMVALCTIVCMFVF